MFERENLWEEIEDSLILGQMEERAPVVCTLVNKTTSSALE